MRAEEIIQGLLLPTEITVRSSRQTWSVLKMQRAEYPELYDGLAKLDETTDEEALFEFLEDVVYRKAEPEMRHLSGLEPRESRELDRAALDFTNGKYRYAASLICLMHSSGDLHSQRIRSTSLAGGQAEHPGFRPAHYPPWLHRTLLGELRGYLPSANILACSATQYLLSPVLFGLPSTGDPEKPLLPAGQAVQIRARDTGTVSALDTHRGNARVCPETASAERLAELPAGPGRVRIGGTAAVESLPERALLCPGNQLPSIDAVKPALLCVLLKVAAADIFVRCCQIPGGSAVGCLLGCALRIQGERIQSLPFPAAEFPDEMQRPHILTVRLQPFQAR